jgi:ATP-dependent Lon protease
MSENLSELKSLPLFPLPLVLLPDEFLPLHIFEDRYRQMLSDVESTNNLFGIVFFNPELADSNLPDVGSIGCIAKIRDVNTLDDGRSNISTIGLSRFFIDEYIDNLEPYSVGEISVFEDFEDNSDELQTLATEVFGLFRRVAKAAHEISGQQQSLPDIPQAEPIQLSFLVAAAFNLPNDLKYELLKTRSTQERLKKLRGILVQAVEQIEESANITKVAKTNGHSKKKIDFN